METEDKKNLIQRAISKVSGKEVGATFGEIGFGTGLDIATKGLLVTPIPGARIAYGGINFLGGAGANYVAQQARTEEDLEWYDRDWGEIISSGLLGIIPGMSGKAGRFTRFVGRPNTYRRAATFGAASGIGDQFIRQGIDEGRLPTGGEIATGGITGSVAGPVFKKSFDEIGKIFTKYQGKSAEEINTLMTDRERSSISYFKKQIVANRNNPEAALELIERMKESNFNYRKNVLGLHKNFKDYATFKDSKDQIVNRLNDKIDGPELPEGVSAREWFKRVDEDIVKEEVLSQGGTEFQAKQIYKDHQKKLTGKKGIKATIKELNDMWNLWEPNTKIKLVSDTETGGKKMMMMTKTGDVKTWEFDHDHIQAVINTNRPEGGLKGADMAENIEIMFRAMNREKSNVFELDERLLRELGVPYDFKEYIFNKLNPDLVPEGIPQRWKEVFSKSILNDYYELKPNTPSSKHSALMGRLIRKYKKVFTNKELLADIEYLEDIPFWKKYPPNEIPKWAQTLEMPNDPLTDKFWNQLPPKAKKRWENMVRRKHQELKFDIKGYKPSKGRYRIQPDD